MPRALHPVVHLAAHLRGGGVRVVMRTGHRLAAVMLCLLACAFTAPAARANLFPEFHLFSDPPPPVPLALGSVLFHFYQEDHRATLAEAL